MVLECRSWFSCNSHNIYYIILLTSNEFLGIRVFQISAWSGAIKSGQPCIAYPPGDCGTSENFVRKKFENCNLGANVQQCLIGFLNQSISNFLRKYSKILKILKSLLLSYQEQSRGTPKIYDFPFFSSSASIFHILIKIKFSITFLNSILPRKSFIEQKKIMKNVNSSYT